MSEQKENTIHSLEDMEALLGESLSNVADLPEYEVPPNGSYKLKLTFEKKLINKKPCLMFNYNVLEVIELANANDVAPDLTKGIQFGEMISFAGDPAMSQAVIKAKLTDLGTHLGCADGDLGKLIAGCDDAVITASVTRRIDKDDATKIYAKVRNILPVT